MPKKSNIDVDLLADLVNDSLVEKMTAPMAKKTA
jgi:hypothetical protein